MANDPDSTGRADRRQRMNRAFEAVETVGLPAYDNLKSLVIVIAAGFTSGHRAAPSLTEKY